MKTLKLLIILFLFLSILHATSDIVSSMYVKPYSGNIIKDQRGVPFQETRIVVGVKNNLTKEQVQEMVKVFNGEVVGWTTDSYEILDVFSIELPAFQRETALSVLKFNPNVRYAIRNYYGKNDPEKILIHSPIETESFYTYYLGEFIVDNKIPSFKANRIVLSTDETFSEEDLDLVVAPFSGKISQLDKLYSSYSVDLPADQRELLIASLKNISGIKYVNRAGIESPNTFGGNEVDNTTWLLILLLAIFTFIAVPILVYKKLKK